MPRPRPRIWPSAWSAPLTCPTPSSATRPWRELELEAAPVDELEFADDALDEPLELLELPALLLELDELPDVLPEALCPLELELLPPEPLPLLEPEPLEPELELLPEPELPLPPFLAKSGVAAMPSDNKVTAQTIDFLNFNMLFPLKVNKVTLLEFIPQIYSFVKCIPPYACDKFPHMIELYVGIYPSSIIRVKYSRKIVLKCNLAVFN